MRLSLHSGYSDGYCGGDVDDADDIHCVLYVLTICRAECVDNSRQHSNTDVHSRCIYLHMTFIILIYNT